MAQPDEAPATGQAGPSTRQRILDVALDLFTEQGFDGTSMRELSARLGITKPSIYYHFASKEEILLALHLRVHELTRDALARLDRRPVTLATWGSALDALLDQMTAHRQLFLLHERNQAALEKLHGNLHRADHDHEHDDFQQRLQQALTDPALPLADRVRMACAFGAVFGGLFTAQDAFGTVPGPELGSLIRAAVHDIVAGAGC